MDAREKQLMELQGKIHKAHAKASGEDIEVDIPKRKGGELPIAYYDSTHKTYLMLNARGEWVEYSEASVKRYLRFRVYDQLTKDEGKDYMIEQHLIELQHKLDVAHVGELAGYGQGMKTVCNQRFLVTKGPQLIKRRAGEWKTVAEFIGELLGEQVYAFNYWLKSAVESLHHGPPFRPGQFLAIAGPAGCGKSLLQHLITEILGGRSAHPYPFMTKDTAFNQELSTAEHLMMEDAAASTDIRIRRVFGTMIKSMLVNETQTIYPKGRTPWQATLFWRLTMSLNDEAENLMVLPPLDDSLADKIMLLRAFRVTFPYDGNDFPGRRKYREKLSAELPAYLDYLWKLRIPKEKQSQRYGCTSYQNPDLLDSLEDLSPESKLLEYIDQLQIWNVDRMPWEGTAAQLEQLLLEKDKLGRVAKLLSYNTATGVYLGRIRAKHPNRVEQLARVGNKAHWRITPKNAP